MNYIEEFQLREDGNTYTIEFDENGIIRKASIYIEELDEEIGITGLIAHKKYWQKKVFQRLSELKDTFEERKYFKSCKES